MPFRMADLSCQCGAGSIRQKVGILLHSQHRHPVRRFLAEIAAPVDLPHQIGHGAAAWDHQKAVALLSQGQERAHQVPGRGHEASSHLQNIKGHQWR